jgi:hypothetical protein
VPKARGARTTEEEPCEAGTTKEETRSWNVREKKKEYRKRIGHVYDEVSEPIRSEKKRRREIDDEA